MSQDFATQATVAEVPLPRELMERRPRAIFRATDRACLRDGRVSGVVKEVGDLLPGALRLSHDEVPVGNKRD